MARSLANARQLYWRLPPRLTKQSSQERRSGPAYTGLRHHSLAGPSLARHSGKSAKRSMMAAAPSSSGADAGVAVADHDRRHPSSFRAFNIGAHVAHHHRVLRRNAERMKHAQQRRRIGLPRLPLALAVYGDEVFRDAELLRDLHSELVLLVRAKPEPPPLALQLFEKLRRALIERGAPDKVVPGNSSKSRPQAAKAQYPERHAREALARRAWECPRRPSASPGPREEAQNLRRPSV